MGLPSSPMSLFTHATLFFDPGRPSTTSPLRLFCLGFWYSHTIAICLIVVDGAVSSFRECGLAYGLCDALCTLQPFRSVIDFTSSTAATLGTSGWLDLARLGLSPNQKHRALLGAREFQLHRYTLNFDSSANYLRSCAVALKLGGTWPGEVEAPQAEACGVSAVKGTNE